MSSPITVDNIGIVVLAAGSSKRFNGDKRHALLGNGKTILENTLSSIPDSFTKRILVVRPGEIKDFSKLAANWLLCEAEAASSGMAHSLKAALGPAQTWQGALIALADMPYIKPSTYKAIQNALGSHDIVIPRYEQQQGNPVAFRQHYFQEIQALQGDKGAKSLLQKYKQQCFLLDCNDSGIIKDIDKPDALKDLHKNS